MLTTLKGTCLAKCWGRFLWAFDGSDFSVRRGSDSKAVASEAGGKIVTLRLKRRDVSGKLSSFAQEDTDYSRKCRQARGHWCQAPTQWRDEQPTDAQRNLENLLVYRVFPNVHPRFDIRTTRNSRQRSQYVGSLLASQTTSLEIPPCRNIQELGN